MSSRRDTAWYDQRGAHALRWAAWTVLAAAALLAVVGCSDNKCQLGQNRCVSDTMIERCEEDFDPYVPPHWEQSECFDDYFEKGLCAVAPTGNAYCAAEAEPRPDLCPIPETATGNITWTCDGTARIIGCIDGLVARSRTCGTGRCVPPIDSSESFCSILTDVDPLCGDKVLSACADATTRVQCRAGYRVEQDTCTDGGVCRTGTRDAPNGLFEVGLCSLTADPDPRCVEPEVSGQTGYCDGLTAVNCYLGYPVSRSVCRSECFDHGYWTACLGETVSEQGWQYGDPPDCADGFDNDYDGAIDYPADSGCAAACCGSG